MNNGHRVAQIESSLPGKGQVLVNLKMCQSQGTWLELARNMIADMSLVSPRDRLLTSVRDAAVRSLKKEGITGAVMDRAAEEQVEVADLLYLLISECNHAALEVAGNHVDTTTALALVIHFFINAIKRGENSEVRDFACLRALLEHHLGGLLVVEGAINNISAEYFDGHQILFSDAEERLKSSLKVVNSLLSVFNCLASRMGQESMEIGFIRSKHQPKIQQKTRVMVNIARAHVLDSRNRVQELATCLGSIMAPAEDKARAFRERAEVLQ